MSRCNAHEITVVKEGHALTILFLVTGIHFSDFPVMAVDEDKFSLSFNPHKYSLLVVNPQ